MASQVGFLDSVKPTSVSVIQFDARPAHGALRQSGKGNSYEDLNDPFTTARSEFFTAPERL